MQTLYFEPAWDRTIATTDREKIIEHFNTIQQQDKLSLSFFREATNHKQETLVTVLIHNPTDAPLIIQKIPIAYASLNGAVKINLFHLPLSIPAHTTMPWTFIFSKEGKTQQEPYFTITQQHF